MANRLHEPQAKSAFDRRPRIAVAVTLILILAGLSSCGDSDDSAADQRPTAMPNPASVYCEEQGGTSVIVAASDGSQSGVCRLPDGTEIDEWEYFRASSTTTTAPGGTTSAEAADIKIFLLAPGDVCDEVIAVGYTPATQISSDEDRASEALGVLLAGPTSAQLATGQLSWFSAATADMLQSVVLDEGTADVSFSRELRSKIPNASSSCGSAGLLAQLDATVLQFESVNRVVYRLDGDVAAFYEWLQMEAP
jgi:putative hemolysin